MNKKVYTGAPYLDLPAPPFLPLCPVRSPSTPHNRICCLTVMYVLLPRFAHRSIINGMDIFRASYSIHQWWLQQRSGELWPVGCYRWRVRICSRFPFRSCRQGHIANSHVPIRYHSVSILLSTRREGDNMESILNLHKELWLYRLALIVFRKHNRIYFLVIRTLNVCHCASFSISCDILSSPKVICFRSSDKADTSLKMSVNPSAFEPTTTCK